MVIYTRVQYIFFSTVCLLASVFAITQARHEMFYVAQGMSSKPEVLINDICFQGLCYLIYYFVTLPKIILSESDKKFADYGKTSSFIMHEIAKPLNRMNSNPENFKEELERLNEIYSIANSLRNKENHQVKLETVDIETAINEIIHKYQDFIDLYHIQISIKIDIHNILTDKKLMHFALDNFIRNAIEANVDFKGYRFLDIVVAGNNISIKNPFIDSNFSKNNLFKPMSTTKKGHMGVGLYISKMITDNLSHKLNIDISKELFEVQICV
jgi:signal transduction histidine kinase